MRPDIAVLQLETPFEFDAFVFPACLPNYPPRPGQACFASGWGHTKPFSWYGNETIDPEDHAKVLQAGIQYIEEANVCEWTHHNTNLPVFNYLRKFEICVQNTSTSVCQVGDTGGPLICEGTYYNHNSQKVFKKLTQQIIFR